MLGQKGIPGELPKYSVFSIIPLFILILSVLWFLDEAKIINTNIPWLPVIFMIISVGWILYSGHKNM